MHIREGRAAERRSLPGGGMGSGRHTATQRFAVLSAPADTHFSFSICKQVSAKVNLFFNFGKLGCFQIR